MSYFVNGRRVCLIESNLGRRASFFVRPGASLCPTLLSSSCSRTFVRDREDGCSCALWSTVFCEPDTVRGVPLLSFFRFFSFSPHELRMTVGGVAPSLVFVSFFGPIHGRGLAGGAPTSYASINCFRVAVSGS